MPSIFKADIEETYQTFLKLDNKPFSILQVKGVVSPTFLALLETYVQSGSDFKSELLSDFVKRTRNKFDSENSELEYGVDYVNASNFITLKFNPIADLLGLVIDLKNFKKEDLQTLVTRINSLPLHNVFFKNTKELPQNLVEQLMDAIYNAEIVKVEDNAAESLASLATALSHRNAIVRFLNVKNQPNIWKAIIRKWAAMTEHNISRQKQFNIRLNTICYYKNIASHGSHRGDTYDTDQKSVLTEMVSIPNPRLEENEHFLNTCIYYADNVFFDKMLAILFADEIKQDRHLDLNFTLRHMHLDKLNKHIIAYSKTLPFTKLSINVDFNLTSDEAFLEFIENLRGSNIESLTLRFPGVQFNTQEDCEKIEAKLIEICGRADYPILLANYADENISLETLTNLLIKNIQNKNLKHLFSNSIGVPVEDEKYPDQSQSGMDNPLFSRKIKLKELMAEGNAFNEQYDKFVKLEVQHIEVIEQSEQIEEKIEVAAVEEVQTEALDTYHGKLIGYDEFYSEPYITLMRDIPSSCPVDPAADAEIKNEYFNGLPNTISYMTHEAAVEIAKNMPAFATMNAYNLPPHFIRKKTPAGELMLDYDLYAPEQKTNLFTPKSMDRYEHARPVYYVSIPKDSLSRQKLQELTAWSEKNELYNAMFPRDANESDAAKPHDYAPKLINLWIMFGDKGVEYFFNKLKEIDQKQKGFALFLFNSYLKHFFHWDKFLANKRFFDSLDRVKFYETNKIVSFKKFLEQTGESRHDMVSTIEAFELFWEKLETLCFKYEAEHVNKNKDKINLLDHLNVSTKLDWIQNSYTAESVPETSWTTLKGGNPVVYMERLLTILENTSSLQEQIYALTCLQLNSYGAYYASKHEGFKLVAREMNFVPYNTENVYDPISQQCMLVHTNCVSADGNAYRISIDDLYAGTTSSDDLWEADEFAAKQAEKKEDNEDKDEDETREVMFKGWKIKKRVLRKWYLIKHAKDELTGDELASLITNGEAFYYTENQFKMPYKLYVQDETGNATLFMEKLPTAIISRDIIARAWRFMGMQNERIDYKYCLEEWQKSNGRPSAYNNPNESELVAYIFFVSHYSKSPLGDKAKLSSLLKSIDGMVVHRNVIKTVLKNLTRLYKLDIKIGVTEGQVLCERIARMNSSEFESTGFNKDIYIDKVFKHLRNNKYGVLKCLGMLYGLTYNKIPFVYALDTAEYLATDPSINACYKDDLITFGLIVNSVYKDAYFSNSESTCVPAITAQLKRIKEVLSVAAGQPKPNNIDHAFRLITNARKWATLALINDIFDQISKLPGLNLLEVEKILQRAGFEIISYSALEQLGDSSELRSIIIDIILVLNHLNKTTPQSISLTDIASMNIYKDDVLHNELLEMNIKQLQERFDDICKQQNTIVAAAGSLLLQPLLKKLRDHMVFAEFNFESTQPELVGSIKKSLLNLKDFRDYSNFENISKISNQAHTIATLLNGILNNTSFVLQTVEISNLLKTINYSVDYEMLYALYTLMNDQPQRLYQSIIRSFISISDIVEDKDKYLYFIDQIHRLTQSGLSSPMIENIVKFMDLRYSMAKEVLSSLNIIIVDIYAKNPDDLTLKFVLNNLANLNANFIVTILGYRNSLAEEHRPAACALFNELHKFNVLNEFIDSLRLLTATEQLKLLEIISKSYVSGRVADNSAEKINYLDFLAKLKLHVLVQDNLASLLGHFSRATLSANCLYNGLNNWNPAKPFSVLLLELERAPYGVRDFDSQFDVSELERVVNKSKDLDNNTPHTYQRRKQIMEAVLFVNAAGCNIPIYNNKPAKDLSDEELRKLFNDIKRKGLKPSMRFHGMLYALALIREAMYRSTKEFPYITQVYALVDGIMHSGDNIANIDTGQGKSSIDTMRGALLWLISNSVEIPTSSLIDAKLQIDRYGSCLTMLGIPYAPKPITAATSFSDFQTKGINFGTFSSLSLFFARARAEDYTFTPELTKSSLVINESDHAILDDMTIYRYAVSEGVGVGTGNEWVYYAINDFIQTAEFKEADNSDQQDLAALRTFLMRRARALEKSPRIVNRYDDDQLLAWIESAILVRYRLRENFAFVIPPEDNLKFINGTMRTTKSIKILMKDGKINPDTTYGNGIQQLLYARLNAELGSEKFVIEQESKTIITTNNKNLIHHYQGQKGFIWGSSGTVGSDKEIAEQHMNYGFAFSKVEPHQKNIVKRHKPKILANEEEQFDDIHELIKELHDGNAQNISLIFCKDIETAKRLHLFLAQQNVVNVDSLQLFTGVGDEEYFVNQARIPGMVTVTTSALGRNTNILYSRALGMNVINAYQDSIRGTDQKAGRTGREGSPGNIYTRLNEQDLKGKTLKQIQTSIENRYASERHFNATLYDVLGYLLSIIDKANFAGASKVAFFKNDWSGFTNRVEVNYRESKLNGTYKEANFVQETVQVFNEMITASQNAPDCKLVNPATLMTRISSVSNPHIDFPVLDKEVKISDCVPPELMAYHFMFKDVGAPTVIKDDVKAKLKQLLIGLSKDNFSHRNQEYFTYLNSNMSSLAIIREAHKEAIAEFLADEVETTKKSTFFQRLFGIAPKLNRIANNQHYILMFKALTLLNGKKPVVTLDALKPLMSSLLDEYLQNSWFVSKERKLNVAAIKGMIENAHSLSNLFDIMEQSQFNQMGIDISRNNCNPSFWRRIKPLNLLGHSRLQDTLTDMSVLMSSLTGVKLTAPLQQLSSHLVTVVKDQSAIGRFQSEPSIDLLEVVVCNAEKIDRGNAKVLTDNIGRMMVSNSLFKLPVVMTGRFVPPGSDEEKVNFSI